MTGASSSSLLREADLEKMNRVAPLLDLGRPAFKPGPRPHRARAGQGAEFFEYRDYRAGEDTRSVDWRASARRGRLQVRTYHDELSADWQVSLDCSGSMMIHPDKFDLARQLAHAMVYLLLQPGHRVGLIEFSDRVRHRYPPGRGRAHYIEIVNRLRHLVDDRSEPTQLGCLTPVLGESTNLVLISDFLAPNAMTTAIARLQAPGRKIHVLQVLSNNELNLDANVVSVIDAEVATRHPVGPEGLRMASDRLHHLQQDLKQYCLLNNIRYSCVTAEKSWQTAIFQHVGMHSVA